MEKEEWETELGIVGDQMLGGRAEVGSGSWKSGSSGARSRKGLWRAGALKLSGWGNLGAGELLRKEAVEED